ncbi:Sulfate permease 2 [Mucor velutinosus]|uniref:Sulfate permease 2 n=1 Tax=Mucor velutinosus TaxID=708070 RepID=A0AAN7DE41_9FUNG|nr:Sulfate permease 2 [Mucor velutinosus]
MNNNNMNDLDPILSWILNSDTTDSNEKPVSDELLGYLLVDEQHQQQQNALTSFPPILPNSQYSPPLPPQPQPQESKLGKRKNGHSSPSEEDENDDPTEDQLKMMPSKERRQLRNKISARNFRNRRKEYMATLEEKMDKCQAENSQLKLEVKWVRGMMDKLQAENDQLRLELALCKGGIAQLPSTTNMTHSTVSPPTTASSNPLEWDIVRAPPLPAAAAAPITTTTATSPTTASSTSSSYPTNLSSTSTVSVSNVYLAHATVPNWNLSELLRKPSSSSVDLIRNYPLLAPALMSIVIQHTMTMTTEDMISNSTMTDPTMPHPPSSFSPLPSSNNHQDKFVAALSDSALWQTIINAKPNTETPPAEETQEQDNDQKLSLVEMKAYMQDYCPLRWIQKQFCMFVLFYVVVQYPRLDKPCRTYLPICDKFRIKRLASK